ncbi:MAG: RecQ family ATP-dependent DNA helicase [Mediterranea sp.]|jgi:ATP-dependent DNA helicase RecQ|nr:RecQ family ATP-dependent DNA helicase [Mediterranea sp.]
MASYKDILKQYWGYDSFRDLQESIILSIGDGKDTLGLMPTGGGKSITFQVPALAKEGLCLVITPLIALMKDQVQHLRKLGIKAAAIYSGMTRREILIALENCIFGDYKFLYISPERLDSELFRTKLRSMTISIITVDESHCISQWGYDFRPAYLRIAEIRALLPGVPVLALTATATPEVVTDIQKRLLFKKENVFRMSFERANLAYIVRYTDNKYGELLNILRKVPGCAIVYVSNRRKTGETAEILTNEGIDACFYHAGLNDDVKDLHQKRWQNNECRVMVATSAFGMGIDKPDVRVVIHMDVPNSPEAYFQEAGRAGRDGKKAYAILIHMASDSRLLHKRIADAFPEKDYIKNLYENLNYYYQMAMGDGLGCMYDFSLDDFCRKFNYFPVPADSALKILTQAGYIEYTEEQSNTSRVIFTLRKEELYRLREMGKEAEAIVQTMLRSYTGIFTDYIYINEESLSIRTGIPHHQIYGLLKMLSERRIIDYIPHKKTRFLIYTRERVECRYLQLKPAVYDERKKWFEQRIRAMVDYITSDMKCRSRMLLRYFGEKSKHNCGQCDICINKRSDNRFSDKQMENIRKAVMEVLQNGRPMTPDELAGELDLDGEELGNCLHFLLDEGILINKDDKISIA